MTGCNRKGVVRSDKLKDNYYPLGSAVSSTELYRSHQLGVLLYPTWSRLLFSNMQSCRAASAIQSLLQQHLKSLLELLLSGMTQALERAAAVCEPAFTSFALMFPARLFSCLPPQASSLSSAAHTQLSIFTSPSEALGVTETHRHPSTCVRSKALCHSAL